LRFCFFRSLFLIMDKERSRRQMLPGCGAATPAAWACFGVVAASYPLLNVVGLLRKNRLECGAISDRDLSGMYPGAPGRRGSDETRRGDPSRLGGFGTKSHLIPAGVSSLVRLRAPAEAI
jgi:hypothetical protein